MNAPKLSRDILCKISEHLSYIDIVNLLSTCKKLFNYFHNATFWTYQCKRHFQLVESVPHNEYKKCLVESILDHYIKGDNDEAIYHVQSYQCHKYDNMLFIKWLIVECPLETSLLVYDLKVEKFVDELWFYTKTVDLFIVRNSDCHQVTVVGEPGACYYIGIYDTNECIQLIPAPYISRSAFNRGQPLNMNYILSDVSVNLKVNMRTFYYIDELITCRFNLALGEFVIIDNGLSNEILIALSYDKPKVRDTCFDYLILPLNDFWLFVDSMSTHLDPDTGYELCNFLHVTRNPAHINSYKNMGDIIPKSDHLLRTLQTEYVNLDGYVFNNIL